MQSSLTVVYWWINCLNTVSCLLSSQFITLLLSLLYECCSWCSQPSVLTLHEWLYWVVLVNVDCCSLLRVRFILACLIRCVPIMQWWAYILFLLVLRDKLIFVRWTAITTTNRTFQVCHYPFGWGKLKCVYCGIQKHYWHRTERANFTKTGKSGL